MIEKVKAFKCTCDYTDCGHFWVSLEMPARCAKCKRRRWNTGGFKSPSAPLPFRVDEIPLTESEESAEVIPIKTPPKHAANCRCTLCSEKRGKRA
jgi:hypothetical protein